MFEDRVRVCVCHTKVPCLASDAQLRVLVCAESDDGRFRRTRDAICHGMVKPASHGTWKKASGMYMETVSAEKMLMYRGRRRTTLREQGSSVLGTNFVILLRVFRGVAKGGSTREAAGCKNHGNSFLSNRGVSAIG